MKQLALQALDSALRSGVSYADVRVVESRDRELATKNGKPGQVGFAATDDLSKSGVESAVAVARSSGLAKKRDVALALIFQNAVKQ